ncbi:DEAD/DEAH box helicase [Holdemania massiliensis]|uniref:DEAD/DEAH box helicase n=1 Tax=Holdemania massiliensis TaxID=1468449 RepID=UPI001F05F44D|nr:DEAD/DEAH box helicase [Holdemania massiliensis]MCH1940421.1 DEAD/DEAH box helicase [Holdemania massiliensis]
MVKSLSAKEIVEYPNGGKSYFYVIDRNAIIVDEGICNCKKEEDIFSYSLITDKQNSYMYNYEKVFRFLAEDIEIIEETLRNAREYSDIKFVVRTANREENADTSPLEFLFEKNFANVYGINALKYLWKEYGIVDTNGHNYFLDYYVRLNNDGIAVEENGITYHHPQIIGKEKYRNQLKKQNSCAQWGIKLYRFSTEDCQFESRIEDDIRMFFGEDVTRFQENGLLVERKVELYDHQVDTLHEMARKRKEGINTFLIVFPTASGKSKIVEEDIRVFAEERQNFKALILAPNTNIVKDWHKRIEISLSEFKDKIEVNTFAYIVRNYAQISPVEYSYIVIDEAHHAVAPVLKRVIQYFTPKFMVGLTATDQRPDKKKLESVFGNYKTGLSLIQAMEEGIVAQANVYRIETNIDLSHVRFNGKDYINADLEKNIRVTSRNELIINVLQEYFCEGEAANRQGIIFCVSMKHTLEMEKLLNASGISANSYNGKTKNADKIMADFKAKKIRFLCVCNMISEGWDYPELGILVMARPTLSKVLYLQQIGRGLRKTDSKKNVYIIDVVDEYGAIARPCSMHSIFQNALYVPFGNIICRNYSQGDMIEIDGLTERIERIVELDITNYEDKYGSYFSQEQLAREFYVSTGTITSWIKKGKIMPTVTYPFGSKQVYLFSPEDVENIRQELEIPEHTEETIKKDFFDFLKERDYSLSYKMPFLLSFLKNMNSIGDANIEAVLDDYIAFYNNRIANGLIVDKPSCPYNAETLKNKKMIKANMLANPFEKFERKRFLYHSKDLGVISMNHALFAKLEEWEFQRIREQMLEDIQNYYKKI